MTGLKYTLAGPEALASNASVNNCIGNIVVQGFLVANTEGQTAAMFYVHDLTLQYNEFTRVATGTNGPTVYVGPGNNGPCNASTSNVGGPDNVTVQYNYIHAGFGEGIYVGASTGDPWYPLMQQQSESAANGMTCGLTCNTGVNYLIAYNTIESTASWGGQGDGTDVKDGHAGLILRGNTYRTSITCTSCGSNFPGGDGQGIVTESGTLIEDNYIETPCHNGIVALASWYNEAGRAATLTIRNNILVYINSSNMYDETGGGTAPCAGSNQNGIDIGQGTTMTCSASPVLWNASAMTCWPSIDVYNNTTFSTNQQCIENDGNNAVLSNAVTIGNNICDSTGLGPMTTSGITTLRTSEDHNDCFNGSTGCTGSGTITSNPNFSSTMAGWQHDGNRLRLDCPQQHRRNGGRYHEQLV